MKPKTDNQILVIFGASGDLTHRKLIPALFELHRLELLPDRFIIIGAGRTEFSDEAFRTHASKSISREYADRLPAFLGRLFYHTMDPQDAEAYPGLQQRIEKLAVKAGIPHNIIFYLSTPPSLYRIIPEQLAALGLATDSESGWRRFIIEKPFGYDFESARELNAHLLRFLNENQIFRIDHYLGKETVQNLLVTRFSNGIFEPLWNRNYIHHVEITSAESLGVEGRGGYYDHSGALRDMLQNHLLQLVSLVAMEPPTVISSLAIRNEMLKVMQALRPIDPEKVPEQVIRGQYISSVIRGEKIPGYREEQGVDPASRTETYVAIKLFIDNWRWGGVPFYIRTGKRLPTKVTEIVIHFKPSPHTLFCFGGEGYESHNQLVIRIQPDEGILLKFGMKVPGAGYHVQDVNMDFHYKDLDNSYLPEAYQRLLLDCMQGDSTLYARGDTVEAAWRFVEAIQHRWNSDSELPLHGYPAGSWGPERADELIEGKGHTWRYPCKNLSDDGKYCEL
ncbi:MAG: glucose-6-phosphate dehydrogenase [Bacteroidota bacterium]